MKISFLYIALSALLFLLLASVNELQAQYIQDNEILTVGQTVTVSVSAADSLIVTYRPGSSISETEVFAVDGMSYEWTPGKAGIASLTTPGGPSQTVSVRSNTFPFAGLIVMLIAGSILFGGAVMASISLFGKTSAEAFTSRPDT